jgi:serine/threonine protein kinase
MVANSMSSGIESFSFDNAPAIGTVLGGKYRLEALVAEGGSSHIFLARDAGLDEDVAVKLLMSEFRNEKDVLARFLREAKTIRRIQSDHCVKVLDVGLDDEHGPFMVMEYLEGKNLREILRAETKLIPGRACELILQVCDALAAAHAIDCVHRDIKPGNVVVLNRGDLELVRVLDFGISKHALSGSVLNHDLSLVDTASLMGTPMYMSPEQMRSNAETDCRADIWSVGAMLHEMLTGSPPFEAESINQVCSMVLEAPAPAVHELDPSLPVELGRVVQKCLSKQASERYQNVGELAVALLPFSPRRARASAARIVSILTAAGVSVDRSAISDYPPAPSNPAPVAIPPSGPLSASLLAGVDARSESDLASIPPAVVKNGGSRRMMVAVPLAVLLLTLAGVAVALARRSAPSAAVAPSVTAPAVSSAERPVVMTASAPPPESLPEPAVAIPQPTKRPHASRAVTAKVSPGAEKPEPLAAPVERGVPSKVRLVDETPSRPKILD